MTLHQFNALANLTLLTGTIRCAARDVLFGGLDLTSAAGRHDCDPATLADILDTLEAQASIMRDAFLRPVLDTLTQRTIPARDLSGAGSVMQWQAA